MNLKKRMVTTMQHSACISKLVYPKGLLGEIQILCVCVCVCGTHNACFFSGIKGKIGKTAP